MAGEETESKGMEWGRGGPCGRRLGLGRQGWVDGGVGVALRFRPTKGEMRWGEGLGKGREDMGVGLGHSREAPKERGRAHGKKGMGVGKGVWTPQLRQGLHGLLADGAGEGIQRLLLDLPLDRGPQLGR